MIVTAVDMICFGNVMIPYYTLSQIDTLQVERGID
jgi:hypothetical protein